MASINMTLPVARHDEHLVLKAPVYYIYIYIYMGYIWQKEQFVIVDMMLI